MLERIRIVSLDTVTQDGADTPYLPAWALAAKTLTPQSTVRNLERQAKRCTVILDNGQDSRWLSWAYR